MMWKRSIVQARGRGSAAARALCVSVLAVVAAVARGADLVIEIPGSGAGGDDAGRYRLDYRPPQGEPQPNYTVEARASTINFQGLPGTKYHFMLYYSNATFADLLTWNQTIVTAPEPPSNLTVALGRNKQATISWAPPAVGDYTGFRFKVIPLGERADGEPRNVTLEAEGAAPWTYTLRDLAPGATYQLHASTLLHDKESAAYASRNFTTKPNTPGKFIVWFRNETTLLVLWQPPYPPGQYTHYKVSIVPADAQDSELYVEKEGEPPGPAQAAFKGLVPGRAYNISVQTVSEPEISAPTTAQYRTVPLRPAEVTVRDRGATAFTAQWRPPRDRGEFEKYQVSVALAGGSAGARRPSPVLVPRDGPLHYRFEDLEPGARYSVTVKTMSGKVTSWPAHAETTLRPLPPRDLRRLEPDAAPAAADAAGVRLAWQPADGSVQDSYRVSYHEAGPAREDSNSVVVTAPHATLDALLPGRNYSVRVAALSGGEASDEAGVAVLTRPLAPALRELLASPPRERSLRLLWSSDVNSRQDGYEVSWRRADEPLGTTHTLSTSNTSLELRDLFPGAVYELRVAALAHGLRSEAHTALKALRPLPPREMTVERASSNSAVVRWRLPPPQDSAVGELVLRYRTQERPWTRLPPLAPNHTEAEIVDMTHGERYTIQLDTASLGAAGDRAESGEPLTATRTVRPSPVSNVLALADTRNVSLEWPGVAGRAERYSVAWRPGGNVSVAAPATGPVRAQLSPLKPGELYQLAIAAHSYNLTSDLFTMETRTRPLIQSEMTIVTESADADDNATLPAFLVIYTRTPPAASTFDTYRFRLEAGEADGGGGGGAAREELRPADAASQQVSFRQLQPGRLYNITMWTLSHNVSSHPVQRQARLFPRPLSWLRAPAVAARSVSLQWGAPAGVFTDFEVQFLSARDRLEARATPRTELELAGLAPHTNYTFSVEVRAGTPATLLMRSRALSLTVTTLDAPPDPPLDFQPVDSKPNEITFSWSLPAERQHGELRRFVIEYGARGGGGGGGGAPRRLELGGGARRATVAGLTPGEEYSFRLWGETGAGAGAAAALTHRMTISAPPRPPPDALPAEARRSPTTVAVRFRGDYFSPANGNVTAYTLVVAEEPRNASGRLPSWRDVRALPSWPPYQAAEPYFPFGAGAGPVAEFTIGAERCEGEAPGYCNGPLRPGSAYYVKLRAYTAPDKYTDTAYTLVHTEVDNTAWIIGGCVAAGAAACGAAAAALLRRRRGGAGGAAGGAAGGGGAAPRASRPVRVSDFLEHYRLMSADSDFRFSEEFEELKPVGREQPCSAADLPVNRPKNRFTNILPYDHSRFKLQPVDDEEGSDYINANYVPGQRSPREFIVTQGPLHCTRDDFWRMCWESSTRAIVMLTRCVEKGREKCDRYWPYDTRPVYYGDIAVTALNETRLPDWTVTELGVARGAEQRVLTHFHFTTWPDFGVPSPPTTLARFVRAFRERVPALGAAARPVVVHCSAGVGRSGTFITLDRALQQLHDSHEYIDIFGMVYGMRRERVWMVQTEQQYICIHQCVAAVLEGQDLAPLPPHPQHHHNQAFEDDEGIAESGM